MCIKSDPYFESCDYYHTHNISVEEATQKQSMHNTETISRDNSYAAFWQNNRKQLPIGPPRVFTALKGTPVERPSLHERIQNAFLNDC